MIQVITKMGFEGGVCLVLILASMLYLPLVASDYQGDALFALRTSLNASSVQLQNWNRNQVNPCTWSNVDCEPNSSNVIRVTLPSMGFTGFLTPQIGVLKTLSTLTLQGNRITGEIPREIGNLSSLTNLNLENNLLTGEIPASLGNLKGLKFLVLSQNNLTGSIPDSLTDLPSLTNLQLASNSLSGRIPDRLFQISRYNFTGNKLNCGSNFLNSCASVSSDTGKSRKPKLGIIIGVVVGVVAILLGCMLFILWKVKNKRYKREVFVDVAGMYCSFNEPAD